MTEDGNPKDSAQAERINNTMKNELLKGKMFCNCYKKSTTGELRFKWMFIFGYISQLYKDTYEILLALSFSMDEEVVYANKI